MIALMLLAAATSKTVPASTERFIRQRLDLDSYRTATADLNGDRHAEIFVYATGSEDCGTGGCTLYILSPKGHNYRVVMRSTIVQLPIRLLETKSHGWRDVGVTVAGGGILNAYMARMQFNGRRYPSNPSVPPAVPARLSGKVLIGR